MRSNVIINFGSNAAALFKDMQKVKSEMKAVQGQAVATTRVTRAASVGGPGMFKSGLSDIRFGMGIITGFLGVNLFREFFNPMKEGFAEVTSKSHEFTRAINLIRDGLVEFGREVGRAAIPLGSLMTDAVAWIVRVTQGRFAETLFRAGMADRATDGGLLTGSEFTSPVADYEKWEAKQLDVAKKQLSYVRDTATTLRKIENDLDRVNMLDPW